MERARLRTALLSSIPSTYHDYIDTLLDQLVAALADLRSTPIREVDDPTAPAGRALQVGPKLISFEYARIGGDVNIGKVVYGDDLTIVVQLPRQTAPHKATPDRPPQVDALFGRDTLLADAATQLKHPGFVALVSMAGNGKKSFAAALTHKAPDPTRVCWVELHRDEQQGAMCDTARFETVAYGIAEFLGSHEDWSLYERLKDVTSRGKIAAEGQNLVNHMVAALSGNQYLVCLIDLHHAATGSLVRILAERLQRCAAERKLQLILTSAERLSFIAQWEELEVPGLDATTVADMLDAAQLPRELAPSLHHVTGGTPIFVTMALQLLKQPTRDPRALLAGLQTERGVKGYIGDELYNTLSGPQQLVMQALAVLGGDLGNRDLLEQMFKTRNAKAALARKNVQDLLDQLADLSLLSVYEDVAPEAATLGQPHATARRPPGYKQHALLRSFCYERLGSEQRLELQRGAGDYFAGRGRDSLRAARYYVEAEAYGKAAQQAINAVQPAIMRGRAGELRQVVAALEANSDTVKAPDRTTLLVVRGRLEWALGQTEASIASLRAARAALSTGRAASTPALHRLTIRICHLLAGALAQSDNVVAMALLKEGEALLVRDESPDLAAALLIRKGQLLIERGEARVGRASLDEGRRFFSADSSGLAADALTDLIGAETALSGSCFHVNDLKGAARHAREAIALCERYGDRVLKIMPLQNLAAALYEEGDWDAATMYAKSAGSLAVDVGTPAQQVIQQQNAGLMALDAGDLDAARQLLDAALGLARTHSFRRVQIGCLTALADLELRSGNARVARILAVEARTLIRATGLSQERLPELLCHRAEALLAQGQVRRAVSAAQAALALAERRDDTTVQGQTLRVLGAALHAAGQGSEAIAACERGAALLAQDPYRLGRLKLV